VYLAQRPHPTQDLVKLYSITSLATSVARTDAQGNKINRLRKSYEGQITRLMLAGRNKAIKHELDPTNVRLGLEQLVHYPDDEWAIQRSKGGRHIMQKGWGAGAGKGWSAEVWQGKVDKAMMFEPKPVDRSRNDEWEFILGHEKIRPGKESKTPMIASKPVVPEIGVRRTVSSGAVMKNDTNAEDAGGIVRPKRASKRRRYNDESFEGYDGFEDDGASVDTADISEDGRRKKARRKVCSFI